MFKIQDGRKSFTQWDLNRKIIVEDDSITQVHFTNLLNKNALVSEVKNHLADVPNVLLQDYGTILIYGYDGNYTKYVEAFRVVRREKPEDYPGISSSIIISGLESGEIISESTIDKLLKEKDSVVCFMGCAYVDGLINAYKEELQKN